MPSGYHHALWIDPENPDYLVNGNDGGLAISYDGGKKWRTTRNTLPAVQFYNVSFDMETPFHVYGSIQDHGSRRGLVRIGRERRVRPVEFESAPGGEASRHAIDPTNSNVVYSEGFYGRISRRDLSEPRRRGRRRGPRIAPRAAEGEDPLRGQWLAPFIISPHNPRIIYHGMNFLYRSMDRGENFKKISPDLTGNDPEKMGDIPYQTIFAISESPLRFGLIYVGTDDGYAHVTEDSGGHWRAITDGVAESRWIACMEASRYSEDRVYMAQNGKRHDDFTPYLWRSDDKGKTWANIAEGIPTGPINVVREDPKEERILYVGTDVGVYVSLDGAKTWHVLAKDLPSTFVQDLKIHPRDDMMIIATHGRGMYVMDVRPIREHGQPKEEEAPEEEPEKKTESRK
jgi:hypothetical protein